MKKHLYLLAAVCLVSGFDNSYSQKVIPNTSVTGVSLAGNKTNRIFIPPPAEFFRKSGTSGRASITLLLNGFPDNAANSVRYAASILETILPPDTKITIAAYWEKITTAGVLANSSITGFAGGWTINAQNPNVAYPIALAEKIAGENLNDSLTSDIDLTVNSTANWYLATDGNTPGLKYDLVTVVLHELCHGLGFFDSMSVNSTIGWYGLGQFPLIYDVFLENIQGRKLTDTGLPQLLVSTEISPDRREPVFQRPAAKEFHCRRQSPYLCPCYLGSGFKHITS